MPNWTPITLEHLHETRTAKLVEPLRTKALADGQPDPFPPAVARTVGELRAAIAFTGKYQLDRDTQAIPSSLLEIAVLAIVRRLKGRPLLSLTDTEKEDERTYQKRLEQLNAGKWPVELPDNPEVTPLVQTSGSSQVVSKSKRQSTSRKLRSL